MKYLIPILLIVLLGCQRIIETKPIQVRYGGLIKDDNKEGLGLRKVKPPPPVTTLPSSFSLITPIPYNQGNEGTCSPFATVYSARSIDWYYKTGAISYSYLTNIFSPEFVYDTIKVGDCGSGSSITACLDFMYVNGVTTWQSVPYSDNGCTLIYTQSMFSEASKYKITYSRFINTDSITIKNTLFSKRAVIVPIIADNSFINATAGFIWKVKSDGQVPHSLTIVGWDDSKHAYKVMNSWGTTWCDGGFGWIDYDFFPTVTGYYLYYIN